jgi:hypothetical protein
MKKKAGLESPPSLRRVIGLEASAHEEHYDDDEPDGNAQ